MSDQVEEVEDPISLFGDMDDWENVKNAMKIEFHNFRFASDRIRSNKKYVIEAIKTRGYLFQYASRGLRSDREFILRQVLRQRDPSSVPYVDNSLLKTDRDVVLECAKVNGRTIAFTSNDFRRDDEIVSVAVKTWGNAVMFIPEKFRARKDIMIEAVNQDGLLLDFASDNLKNDREILLTAVKNDPRAFVSSLLCKDTKLKKILDRHDGNVEEALEEYGNLGMTEENMNEVENNLLEICGDYLRTSRYVQKSNFFIPHFLEKDEIMKEQKEIKFWSRLMKKIKVENFNKKLKWFNLINRGYFGSVYKVMMVKELLRVFALKIYHQFCFGTRKKSEFAMRDSIGISYHENVVPVLCCIPRCKIHLKKLPDYDSYWKGLRSYETGMVFMFYYPSNLKILRESRINIRKGLKRAFTFGEIEAILKSIAKGLNHLHGEFIVHRDLHMANVFIDCSKQRLWVGDFGCSLDLSRNHRSLGFKVHKSDERLWSKQSKFSEDELEDEDEGKEHSSKGKFVCGGSPKFLPPEVLKFDYNGKEEYIDYEKCDVYSLGVIGLSLWECSKVGLEVESKNLVFSESFGTKYKLLKYIIDQMSLESKIKRFSCSQVLSVMNNRL